MEYTLCLLHRPAHSGGSYETKHHEHHEHHEHHAHEKHKYHDAKGRELVAIYVPDHYMETLYAVVKTMQDHPETWKKYEGTEHEWADIIHMEIEELQTRMKDAKASPADIARECKHVAAACLCKYTKVQKMYE